jgi:hypothetical protein
MGARRVAFPTHRQFQLPHSPVGAGQAQLSPFDTKPQVHIALRKVQKKFTEKL